MIMTVLATSTAGAAMGSTPFVAIFTIFVLAIFVGYYVVWGVTPALHTPLMAVPLLQLVYLALLLYFWQVLTSLVVLQ